MALPRDNRVMRFLSGLSPRATGLLAAVVTVAIWTSFIVIARASAQFTLGPYDIAFARILGASAVLLPVGWWMVRQQRAAGTLAPGGGWLDLSPLAFRISAVCGFFGGLMYAVLAYAGFFHAPAAHASVLMPGSLPLWTTLLAVLILHTPITPARAIGLACIVGGDLLVGGASLLKAFGGGEVWKGDLLFMSASFSWAIFTILCRRWQISAVHSNIAVLTFASVTLLPAYALLVATGTVSSRLAGAPWREILAQGVLQGWLSVVISGIGFMKMVESFGPVRTTMITAVVPGLSALCAMALLGEPLSWVVVAGLACVTAGIFVGVRGATAQPAAAQTADPRTGVRRT